MRSRWDWVGAATGVVAIIVGFLGIVIGGEPTSADEGADKVVAWYADNKDQAELSAIFAIAATALLIFFFAYLRRVLQTAETATGRGGMLPLLAVIGAGIIGTGIAIDTTIMFAAAEAVDNKVDPTAVLAMQAIWDNDFMPIALGTLVVLWSVGLAVVLHGGLPKWLGWVAIVLGLIAPTPIGFAAVLGLLVWVLVVSILLTARSLQARSVPDAAAT